MTFLKRLDNKGIALITALMMSVLTLTIIMGVLFLITENIKGTASRKSYRNVIEASYGGAELVSREIIPLLFKNVSTSVLRSNLSTINAKFTSSNCLRNKMSNSSDMWGTSGSTCNTGLNPKIGTDMSFELSGADGVGYNVFAKIVDTVPGVPYSDVGTSQLVGGGVAENSSGTTIELRHYIFRIEITGERKDNPAEKSNISVLYEY